MIPKILNFEEMVSLYIKILKKTIWVKKSGVNCIVQILKENFIVVQ